jgi:type II secretory ATPase GspE/PulE/Tfp pilus assembly ATPase PilB-like protein
VPHAIGDSAKFLATLLEFAVARGASDLHLCPSEQGAFVRLRIDGELLTQEHHHYPGEAHAQMVSRLKVLSGLDIACKHLPQDGACTVAVGNTAKSIRLSTLPTVHGESVVIRFLYARRLPQLSTLGVEPMTMALLRKAIHKTGGVILLTGPTGSGKTTTMYSVALELQNHGRNVVTVEDPVEAPLPGMVQVQVRETQGLDYPRAIRSVLRHDPDVILIGEMRDAVSARIALTAALTGHLTISSLHMGSALQGLERLRSFEIPARECVQGISLILNQRLVPRLCRACKVVDPHGSERFKRTIFQPAGCAICGGTGFDGRVLITEALDLLSPMAKDAYGDARTFREAISAIPSSAFIPWTQALEYHLTRGDLSSRQVQEFVDEEMALD